MKKNKKGLLFTIIITIVLMSIFSCGWDTPFAVGYDDGKEPAEIHTERGIVGDVVTIYGIYSGGAVWYYYDGAANRGAYYYHNNEERFRITQEARDITNDNISNFEIQNGQAIWRYYNGASQEATWHTKILDMSF